MSRTDEDALLAIARQAAGAAASELLSRFARGVGGGGEDPRATADDRAGVRSKSTPTDLVSDADLAAEDAVRSLLRGHRPDDLILGEEGGASPGGGASGDERAAPTEDASSSDDGALADGQLRWVVDPLDGTVNYLFGIPAFAVSIACEDASGPIAGVVLDPIRSEWFAATRSGPATLNGEPIRGSGRSELSTAMVATGFAYDATLRARQAAVAARVLPRVRDIRRVGAAALDLAWSACGRYDAYYERGLHLWDFAAGTLIAGRAGLEVRKLPAKGEDPAGIVAGPRGLIDELIALVG